MQAPHLCTIYVQCFLVMGISRRAHTHNPTMRVENLTPGRKSLILLPFGHMTAYRIRAYQKIYFSYFSIIFRIFPDLCTGHKVNPLKKFDRAVQNLEILLFRTFTVSSPFPETSFLLQNPLQRRNCSGTYDHSKPGYCEEAATQTGSLADPHRITTIKVRKASVQASKRSYTGRKITRFKTMSIILSRDNPFSTEKAKRATVFQLLEKIPWLN